MIYCLEFLEVPSIKPGFWPGFMIKDYHRSEEVREGVPLKTQPRY